MIKRLVFSAAVSGIVVGLLITVLQSYTVIPMILDAETYESTSQSIQLGHNHAHGSDSGMATKATSHTETADSHDHHAHENLAGGHHHEADEWTPDDGMERTFYTAVTNILAATGFALLLATCFMFRQNINWRKGILWGLGGFIAFQLAPSLGLPPELPGTAAAAVEARQLWWITTALSTATGLLLLAVAQRTAYKSTGFLFILIPHIVGAPEPAEHSALAPQSLITQFIVMTTFIGAIFWVMLGAVTAYAHNKLEKLG